MLGDDVGGYNPLATYWWGWLAIAVGLVALVLGWYVLVWLLSRRATERVPVVTPPEPAPSREDLQRRYLAMVDEIVERYDGGELSRRLAHQKFGTLVRFYAHEASGVRADVMTLDDLTRARLGGIAHAVSVYYPAEFASVESGDVHRSAEIARNAVRTWW